MCNHCGGKGIIKVCYHDGTATDYAVCLCEEGLVYRNAMNAGKRTEYPLWMVWAAREQVPHERIAMLEDILEPDELRQMGFGGAPTIDDDLTQVGKTRKGKL